MYVASAVYADHAGTADTASNALKLGGYDASDYLRKDEVQTVTAAYQEMEWTTPGTYNWVVPEGVNSILVTTVGGGGGAGYYRWRTPYSATGNEAYHHMFPGGGGAQVTPNVVVKTTPGETITVVVGKGGTNAVANSNWQDKSVYERFVNKNGGTGGNSYIARNGTMISATLAKGGNGGKGSGYKFIYQSGNVRHYGVDAGTAGGSGGTSGMWAGNYYSTNVSPIHYYVTAPSGAGTYGYKGSVAGEIGSATINYGHHPGVAPNLTIMHGRYIGGGGGASYGNGAGNDGHDYGKLAGIGGGGATINPYSSMHGGNGYVHILAIGITYDK